MLCQVMDSARLASDESPTCETFACLCEEPGCASSSLSHLIDLTHSRRVAPHFRHIGPSPMCHPPSDDTNDRNASNGNDSNNNRNNIYDNNDNNDNDDDDDRNDSSRCLPSDYERRCALGTSSIVIIVIIMIIAGIIIVITIYHPTLVDDAVEPPVTPPPVKRDGAAGASDHDCELSP